MSAYTDLINALNGNIVAPLLDSQKIADNDKLILDFLLNQNDDDFPDWTAGQTFQTDGSDDGIYCKYADTNGRKRIFETKTDNNIGNAPPTDPGITETTHWRELSQSAAASIPEYAPGVFGTGLKMVFFEDDIYKLQEAVRPFTSSNLLTELAAGKWKNLTRKLPLSFVGDLNSILQAGFYYIVTSSCTNYPAGAGYGILSNQLLNSTTARQTYHDSSNNYFVRVNSGGVWSAWKRLVNNDELTGVANAAIYVATAGAVRFDGNFSYGFTTAVAGTITFNITGALDSTLPKMLHNDTIEPTITLPGGVTLISTGEYVPNVNNLIYFSVNKDGGGTVVSINMVVIAQV